jgi:pilus assembly protein CpaF
VGQGVSAVDTVESEVRELVRRRGLDPFADAVAMRSLADEVVEEYDERAMTSTLTPLVDLKAAARAVHDAFRALLLLLWVDSGGLTPEWGGQ